MKVKEQLNKVCALLLAVAMVIGFIPFGVLTANAEEAETSENVALNATVLGVSNETSPSGEEPYRAFDGDYDTKWCVAQKSGWIAIDLGDEYDIERWKTVHGEYADGSSVFNTEEFALEVLTDSNATAADLSDATYLAEDTNWTEVDYVDNSTDAAMIVDRELEKTVTGQYFRLRVDVSSSNWQYQSIRIHEWEMYEAEAEDTVLEDGTYIVDSKLINSSTGAESFAGVIKSTFLQVEGEETTATLNFQSIEYNMGGVYTLYIGDIILYDADGEEIAADITYGDDGYLSQVVFKLPANTEYTDVSVTYSVPDYVDAQGNIGWNHSGLSRQLYIDWASAKAAILDGAYTADVALWNASSENSSMANGCLTGKAKIVADSGKYTMTVYTQELNMGTTAWLEEFYVENAEGTYEKATVETTNEDGNVTSFSFTMPSIYEEYLNVQVIASAMGTNAISARLKIDWVSLTTYIDKSALESKLKEANAITSDDYTSESYAVLQNAITAAQTVYDDANATQDDVNAQVTALEKAIAALEKVVIVVDKSALESKLKEANAITSDDYTADSYAALQNAMTAAQTVYDDNNATQDAVNAQVTALDNAIAALVEQGGIKTGTYIVDVQLWNATMDQASMANGALTGTAKVTVSGGVYTMELYTQQMTLAGITAYLVDLKISNGDGTYTDAVALTKDADGNTISFTFTLPHTDEYVDVLVNPYVEAMGNSDIAARLKIDWSSLREYTGEETDKSALESKLADAKAKVEDRYTEESYADLEKAIAAAQAVYNNLNATQEEIDAQIAALETVIEALVVELPFTDLQDDGWYLDAVEYVYENGYMNGKTDTTFGPDEETTRAQFVTVLARVAEAMGEDVSGYSSNFSDVESGAWYTDYVSWAQTKEIVIGYNATTFGTHDSITREQMAILFVRFAQYMGISVSGNSGNTVTDMDEVSDWAANEVSEALDAGYISGFEDGLFRPQGTATRAQIAQVITNFMTQLD